MADLKLTGPKLDQLAKVRRKVENAQAAVRAAQSDLASAQALLQDALRELKAALEADG